MSPANMYAVVPVKPFGSAKLRLASVLAPVQRERLAQIMAEDVLDALDASKHLLAGILVVTADADAAKLARHRGALVLLEREPAGINQAIALASDWLRGSDKGMMVIPADLPHITETAIATLAHCLAAPRAVALVPAINDGGTNMLGLQPARIIPPSFGNNSFERHREAAHAVGVLPSILHSAELGCDIDRPEDLDAFMSLRTATRTHNYLTRLGVTERTVASL